MSVYRVSEVSEVSVEIGKGIFQRLGCHSQALSRNRERSSMIWLLAGRFAEQWLEDDVREPGFMGWPSIWWLPQHRPPDPPFFLSHFAELDHNIDWDAITLGRWQQYARRRLPMIERYGFYLALLNGQRDLGKLMQVYDRNKL